MLVSEVLKNKGTRVEIVRPDATVADVARIMTEERIGSVLVCDLKGKVVGLLSEPDIVRSVAKHGAEGLGQVVADVMYQAVVSCAPDDDLKRVMGLMTHRRIRHLPVVEKGELLGIISIGDVVKNLLDETRLEVSVLRDYVRTY